MAEVIGTIAAVNQILENAIQFIGRLRKAYQHTKDLKDFFDKLEQEVSSIGKIIQIVKEEVALQTDSVDSTLLKLEATEKKLVKWLKRVDPGGKGPIRQFGHQLVHGSKERKALAEIMNELSRVKADLCMSMQVAHVGVTWTVGDKVVANSKMIRRIDRRLRRTIGRGGGLKIARLLKDRPLQGDGSVQLSDADIASLDSEDSNSSDSSELTQPTTPGWSTDATPRSSAPTTARSSRTTTPISSATTSAKPSPTRERIVLENTAERYAIMVNAPIGDDLWRDMDRIQIKGNSAKEAAMMINYITSRDNLDNLANIQERRMQSSAFRG